MDKNVETKTSLLEEILKQGELKQEVLKQKVYTCCIDDCNSRKTKYKGLSFHKFPEPNSNKVIFYSNGQNLQMDRREAWEYVLNMGYPRSKYKKICSLHFTKDDFILADFPKRRTLKTTAIPSQCLPTNRSINNIGEIYKTSPNYKVTILPKLNSENEKHVPVLKISRSKVDDFVIEDMDNWKNAQLMYKLATKEIEENNKTLKSLLNENSKLEKKIEELEQMQKRGEKICKINNDDLSNKDTIDTEISIPDQSELSLTTNNINNELLVTKVKNEPHMEIEEHEVLYPKVEIKEEIKEEVDPLSTKDTTANFEFVGIMAKEYNYFDDDT